MKNFEPAPSRHPRLAAAGRILLGTAVAGLFAATLMTAGPGNHAALRTAAPARVYVTLPTMVIVGRREQAQPMQVASSAPGRVAAERSGMIPLDPGPNRVNLEQ